ncbi:MAG: hypothetical protein AVDCRST_MAG68-4774, partial [uncultured Gemmatimonadetes bacterium]
GAGPLAPDQIPGLVLGEDRRAHFRAGPGRLLAPFAESRRGEPRSRRRRGVHGRGRRDRGDPGGHRRARRAAAPDDPGRAPRAGPARRGELDAALPRRPRPLRARHARLPPRLPL